MPSWPAWWVQRMRESIGEASITIVGSRTSTEQTAEGHQDCLAGNASLACVAVHTWKQAMAIEHSFESSRNVESCGLAHTLLAGIEWTRDTTVQCKVMPSILPPSMRGGLTHTLLVDLGTEIVELRRLIKTNSIGSASCEMNRTSSLTEALNSTEDQFFLLLRNLPSELFDLIFDFVLSPSTPTLIHKHYEPPILLRLSRSCRSTFSSRFYGSSRGFHFAWDHRHLVVPWLRSLEPSQRRKLRIVSVDGSPPAKTKALVDSIAVSEIDRDLGLSGIRLLGGVLRVASWKGVGSASGRWDKVIA